jgi:hypothetical protein
MGTWAHGLDLSMCHTCHTSSAWHGLKANKQTIVHHAASHPSQAWHDWRQQQRGLVLGHTGRVQHRRIHVDGGSRACMPTEAQHTGVETCMWMFGAQQ